VGHVLLAKTKIFRLEILLISWKDTQLTHCCHVFRQLYQWQLFNNYTNQCVHKSYHKQGSLDIKQYKWRDVSGHAASPVTSLLCSIIREHFDNFPIWTHVSTFVRSRNWTLPSAGNREWTFPLCRSCRPNGLQSVSPAVQNQLLHLLCAHIALLVLDRPGRTSWGCPFDDVRKLCAVLSPAKLSLWYHRTWLSTGREFRQQQYCLLCPRTATSITNFFSRTKLPVPFLLRIDLPRTASDCLHVAPCLVCYSDTSAACWH
jgi:hypothetical protein